MSPSEASMSVAGHEPWRKVALGLALAIGLSIPTFIVFGLTIGLITGLVVLVAPLYVLALQMGIAALVVALCLWRRRYGLARLLGMPLVIVPEVLFAGWYLRERHRCVVAADPRACFAYLDGSPLLMAFVLLASIVSLVMCGMLWYVVAQAATTSTALPSSSDRDDT
jgi:hypothetical protein